MSKKLVERVDELLMNLAKMNRGSVGKSMYRGGYNPNETDNKVQELLMNVARQAPNGKTFVRGGGLFDLLESIFSNDSSGGKQLKEELREGGGLFDLLESIFSGSKKPKKGGNVFDLTKLIEPLKGNQEYELYNPQQEMGGKMDYDDDNDIWGDKKPKKSKKGKSDGVMSGEGDLKLAERVKKLRDGHREWLMKYNALKERGYTPKEAKELIKKHDKKIKKKVKYQKYIKPAIEKRRKVSKERHEEVVDLLDEIASKL